MSHFEVAALVKKVESHCRDLFGVVRAGIWKATNNHVSVANCFDLEHGEKQDELICSDLSFGSSLIILA